MPYKDPEKRRAASRASQRARRSKAAGAGAQRRSGVDTPQKTSTRAGAARVLDPVEVLERLAAQLELLDADDELDTAVRARTVARVCAVALAAHRQADEAALRRRADEREDGELDYSELTNRELASLRRLAGKIRRVTPPR